MVKFTTRLLPAFAALVLFSCTPDRENTLKVYNWSNYIGDGVISDFEQWYQAHTGKKISVIYQTFDINETMLSKIEKGHEDFDVVCPSDYIIERMLNSGLLLPLDFEHLPDSINYINSCESPYMREMLRSINPVIDANDYSVAYMWGTTGILYNREFVSDTDASTWNILRNPRYAGKILIKDAARDVFGPVIFFLRREELSRGEISYDSLMRNFSEENLSAVETFMKEVKEGVAGWEADFGKEQMTQQKGWVSLNWSGDAVWAIKEGAEVGVDLAYRIPEEGSTVWMDGWVIPKFAGNAGAATWFIDFMCRPDIAIRNMEKTGYVSANGDLSVLESQYDESRAPVDVSYFFGDRASSVRVDPALYPDRSTIARCAMLHDWGKDTDHLIQMWSRVKGENADTMTIVVIGAVFAGMTFFGIRSRLHKKSRKRAGRPF